ncbi:GNAT family N-acetyltransferase [Actinomadura verrucosospora]|uniref:N-acetyltransferase GCN5 n=1 Tax=Actinomadura verrucosospora TaxID=46165 RepID=A0A7D3W0E7_ACTVE|nr:GNAT family N-acetyltransferase [Actinomadura verrucosospora]QKG23171.1 N-acetyltransferase GCN5 [Actinomadura verrucosospora]
MPLELVRPTTAVHASFLAAMAEFRDEGRGTPDDRSQIGRDLRDPGIGELADPGVFAAYVARVNADALPESPRPRGFVPSTTFWLVDGGEYLGRIQVRHRLTEWLRDVGGHIGYDVRESARRRGHASLMLRQVLPHARRLGVDPALVTCDEDNIGSRKVIESVGGVLEDVRDGKRRYWLPTA